MDSPTVSWRELLHETSRTLGDEQHARWICEEVSGCRGLDWVGVLDDPVGTRALSRLDAMIAQRLVGRPLQYVLGSWSFRRIDLLIDERVLIPRPETEVVTQHAIDLLRACAVPRRAVDLGTGSGAIALSLAVEMPLDSVEVWATDVSDDALSVCRANLAGIGRPARNVRLALGPWFEALPQALVSTFDLVVSNPPYIAPGDPDLAPDVSDWEPHVALFGGDDGLADLRAITAGATTWLRPGGWLVCEIGAHQGLAVAGLARGIGLVDVEIRPDQYGADRVLIARRAD